MPRPDHPSVESVFLAIAAMPESERAAALDRMCDGDASLRREVESLLRFHAASSAGALDRSPLLTLSGGLAKSLDDQQLPPRLTAAGYTLQSVLGSGGMGVVYVAHQHKPSRTVALKVIRPASATDQMLRRFEHEAELLARLQHPGIAQVYGTGIADFGNGQQPFIAMELVHGLNLLDFAKQRSLNIRERLDLVARICDAVQHAHQRGVIHRDLKPANILIADEQTSASGSIRTTPASGVAGGSTLARVEGWAQPKILDFGVARTVEADLGVTVHTTAGQLIGTLPYMSPEQVAAEPGAIDVRSDVYALGTILFQLLADRLPLDLAGKSIAEAVRIIREEPAARLGAIRSDCRGDVETIVAKAMEKEKERRYQSAAELAADIRRHLNDSPIEARPATAIYQMRKFVKRHRTLVGAAAIAMIALAAGAAAAVYGMIEARVQRDEALRSGRIAQAVNDFLNNDLLAQADPTNQPKRDLTLREALDYAAASVATRFADEPQVQAAIRTSLGRTYQSLGEFDKAETQLRAALAVHQHGEIDDEATSLAVLEAQMRVADVLRLRGEYDAAEAMCQRILDRATPSLGEDHETVLFTRDILALTLEKLNRYREAQPLVEETLALRIAKHGGNSPEVLPSLRLVGLMYERNGQFELAEKAMLRAVDATSSALGDDHPQTLSAMNNLSLVYFGQQRYAEAQAILDRVYERSLRVLGSRHSDTLAVMGNLAMMMMGQQKNAEAEALMIERLRLLNETLGPTHSDTLNGRNSLAGLYYRTKQHDKEEPLLRETLDIATRVYGENHLEAMVALASLARMQLSLKRFDEARENGETAYTLMAKNLGEEHPITQMMATYLVSISKGLDDAQAAAKWQAKVKR